MARFTKNYRSLGHWLYIFTVVNVNGKLMMLPINSKSGIPEVMKKKYKVIAKDCGIEYQEGVAYCAVQRFIDLGGNRNNYELQDLCELPDYTEASLNSHRFYREATEVMQNRRPRTNFIQSWYNRLFDIPTGIRIHKSSLVF